MLICLLCKTLVLTVIENDEKCAICLEDFRADQLVREINCKHKFHISCIDTWLNTVRTRFAKGSFIRVLGRFFSIFFSAFELPGLPQTALPERRERRRARGL